MSTALTPYANQYVAKKALFSFMGNTFRIFGADGRLQFFIKQKAFRLKEEITVFADESQSLKRLRIQARSYGDFSGTYDITDAQTGEKVGAARREGFKSMFVDEWTVLDTNDQPVGKCREAGGLMILLRRFLPIIPQTYTVHFGDTLEGTIKQQFSLFSMGYDVDFSPGPGKLDPRLGVGLTVLLLAIESTRDG